MRSFGGGTLVLVALSCFIRASAVDAQDVQPERAGDSIYALPALVRVPVAGPMDTGVVLAGHAGYGFTEGVLGESDTHHRVSGVLAASVRPTRWLGVALRLDGRYDAHSAVLGTDDGFIGEARLVARAAANVSRAFALGFEMVVFVPGQDAPSFDLEATTVDASALFTWSPSSALSLAATAGMRFDRSGRSVPQRDQLTRADRLALGVSDSNALLLGLGASFSLTSVELVAELTADLLFGANAPPLGQSPLRIAAGARVPLVDGLALSLLAEAALSARPALAPGDALVPVEPRFSLLAGLVWQTLRARAPTPPDDPVIAPPPPRPALAAPPGRVTGVVRDERDAPLVGATVTLDGAEPHAQTTTGADGTYTLEGVPTGREVRLRIGAPGRSDSFITVIVNADTPTDAGDVALEPARPAGVIRGLVRSLRGHDRGLASARIAVEPGGHSAQADAHGEFEIEVPPGEYDVAIEAPGHTAQRRHVTVEHLGVTVLNIDLHRSR